MHHAAVNNIFKGERFMYQIKGKIDSNNALEFENEIMAAMPNEIDASELSYISSAGLRVLLKLNKKIDEVTIYN